MGQTPLNFVFAAGYLLLAGHIALAGITETNSALTGALIILSVWTMLGSSVEGVLTKEQRRALLAPILAMVVFGTVYFDALKNHYGITP